MTAKSGGSSTRSASSLSLRGQEESLIGAGGSRAAGAASGTEAGIEVLRAGAEARNEAGVAAAVAGAEAGTEFGLRWPKDPSPHRRLTLGRVRRRFGDMFLLC